MESIDLTELILVLVVPGCFVILPILALIDISRCTFARIDTIMFVLMVIFVPVLGAILYFIMGPTRKIKKE